MPNELQNITFTPSPTGGTYTLSCDGQTTGAVNFNDIAGTIEGAFQALASVGAGNALVSGEADTGTITISFSGALANTSVPQTTCDASGLTAQGAIGSTAETTAGTYQWTAACGECYGTWISGIDISTVTAANLQTYLRAAASDSSITVSGGVSDANLQSGFGFEIYGFSFAINYSAASIEYFAGGLGVGSLQNAGDGAISALDTDASSGTQEVQTIPAPTANGGTFTVTGTAEATGALAWNIAQADLQTALNALSDITAEGGVVVSGTDGGPWIVTWNTPGPQALLTTDGTLLTVAVAATASTTQQGGAPIAYGSILKSAMISCEKVCA